MLRFIVVFFAGTLLVLGNPIAIETVYPPYIMIGENVLVSVTEKGAVVSGRYRFHVTPDAAEKLGRSPYRFGIQLPVPISAALNTYDAIVAATNPVVTIKGARYLPAHGIAHLQAPPLPSSSRLFDFRFRINREDLGDEFDLEVQYFQPIIADGGEDIVYYVPFLPYHERYQAAMGMNESSFLITFKSFGDVTLRLASPTIAVEPQENQLISVHPKDMEVIAIQRIQPIKVSKPAVPSVTPVADPSVGPAPAPN